MIYVLVLSDTSRLYQNHKPSDNEDTKFINKYHVVSDQLLEFSSIFFPRTFLLLFIILFIHFY
jgi:hypothetical protein